MNGWIIGCVIAGAVIFGVFYWAYRVLTRDITWPTDYTPPATKDDRPETSDHE